MDSVAREMQQQRFAQRFPLRFRRHANKRLGIVAARELGRHFQRDNRCENEAYKQKFHNLDAKA